MILEGESVKLVPFSEPWNMEYLFQLMAQYKYEKDLLPRAKYEEAVRNGKHFWLVYSSEGVLGGVIYLCYHKDADRWSLDGYRDDILARSIRDQRTWSLEAGELVCNYFFSCRVCDILFVGLDARNKLEVRLVESLGFKEVERKEYFSNEFILMEKRRE